MAGGSGSHVTDRPSHSRRSRRKPRQKVVVDYEDMSVRYGEIKLQVPQGFKQLLEDLSREVLREQPKSIPKFAAAYFNHLLERREKGFTDGGIYGQQRTEADKPDMQELPLSQPKDESQPLPETTPQEEEMPNLDDPDVQKAAAKIQASFRGFKKRKSLGDDGSPLLENASSSRRGSEVRSTSKVQNETLEGQAVAMKEDENVKSSLRENILSKTKLVDKSDENVDAAELPSSLGEAHAGGKSIELQDTETENKVNEPPEMEFFQEKTQESHKDFQTSETATEFDGFYEEKITTADSKHSIEEGIEVDQRGTSGRKTEDLEEEIKIEEPLDKIETETEFIDNDLMQTFVAANKEFEETMEPEVEKADDEIPERNMSEAEQLIEASLEIEKVEHASEWSEKAKVVDSQEPSEEEMFDIAVEASPDERELTQKDSFLPATPEEVEEAGRFDIATDQVQESEQKDSDDRGDMITEEKDPDQETTDAVLFLATGAVVRAEDSLATSSQPSLNTDESISGFSEITSLHGLTGTTEDQTNSVKSIPNINDDNEPIVTEHIQEENWQHAKKEEQDETISAAEQGDVEGEKIEDTKQSLDNSSAQATEEEDKKENISSLEKDEESEASEKMQDYEKQAEEAIFQSHGEETTRLNISSLDEDNEIQVNNEEIGVRADKKEKEQVSLEQMIEIGLSSTEEEDQKLSISSLTQLSEEKATEQENISEEQMEAVGLPSAKDGDQEQIISSFKHDDTEDDVTTFSMEEKHDGSEQLKSQEKSRESSPAAGEDDAPDTVAKDLETEPKTEMSDETNDTEKDSAPAVENESIPSEEIPKTTEETQVQENYKDVDVSPSNDESSNKVQENVQEEDVQPTAEDSTPEKPSEEAAAESSVEPAATVEEPVLEEASNVGQTVVDGADTAVDTSQNPVEIEEQVSEESPKIVSGDEPPSAEGQTDDSALVNEETPAASTNEGAAENVEEQKTETKAEEPSQTEE